ncbi:hypothetical protein GGI25_004784 [Coemansia spiralis]|uniref:Cytochrome P450 n=2 Tax=Coemansia TaxID=4863 RepID=A0A9W8KVA2_9FUNG|nr:hypothetical protein EDC05_005125 [Coemansia umbellata]KAJ2620086.1 hypothetical protein GGI26_005318 [Coemansia sp. RSA 1358]KAJ2673265.1 hypothetical protein GGI25_004784 [Coemansia spiralis]
MFAFGLDAVRGRLCDVLKTNSDYYGDIYAVGPKAVSISHPEDCKAVLGSHHFVKGDMYQAFALLGDMILTTKSAELAKTRRKQLSLVFSNNHIRQMEPMILDCGIKSIKRKWDSLLASSSSDEATVNYMNDFFLAIFDILGVHGFSQRFNALQDGNTDIIHWIESYNKLSMYCIMLGSLMYVFPFTLFTGKLIKELKGFTAFANSVINERKVMLKSGKAEKPNDFLQAYIDTEDPDSAIKMTPDQITAEVVLLFIGGTDNTTWTMVWTLHYIMLYPEVHRKVVNEVRSKFPRDHTITYAEGKANLAYLEGCIYESMRIQPVSGFFLPRTVPKGGATFQGHFIPGGALIGPSVVGSHHHRESWANPHEFKPERFISNEAAKQNVFSFGGGVRVCPGKQLAHYEMVTILANIFKDYDIDIPHDALFRPEIVDKFGSPIAMPPLHNSTIGAKYPERDCRIVVKHAPADAWKS